MRESSTLWTPTHSSSWICDWIGVEINRANYNRCELGGNEVHSTKSTVTVNAPYDLQRGRRRQETWHTDIITEEEEDRLTGVKWRMLSNGCRLVGCCWTQGKGLYGSRLVMGDVGHNLFAPGIVRSPRGSRLAPFFFRRNRRVELASCTVGFPFLRYFSRRICFSI